MRFYPPTATDELIAPVVGLAETQAEKTWNKTMETIMLMHSSNSGAAEPATPWIDYLRIEEQARAARSAHIAKHTRAFVVRLVTGFEHGVAAAVGAIKLFLAKPVKH